MTAPPERHDRRAPSAHLVFGTVIILIGIIFTLDNLDIADADDYLRYWPAALIVVGMAKLMDARARQGSLFGGALMAVVGTWLLLDNLEVITVSLRDFWPVLLVLVGGNIVWQGIRGRQSRPTGDGAADSTVSAVAVLSGVNRRVNSPAFRGGELTAFMGGCVIDLRHASIDGEAVIDVFAMWGGIEIRVPEGWTVIGQVTPLLGGFEDGTQPPAVPGKQRLVIRGVVIMGGIEIKN